MPFGLCSATTSFQRLMQHCLGGQVHEHLLISLLALLKSIETSYLFEVVGLDYLSLSQPNDVYLYILVMTDLFSRDAFAVPTEDQTATTTVKVLCTHLIWGFGCPKRIVTDQAFESQLMKQLCDMYGCRKSKGTEPVSGLTRQ